MRSVKAETGSAKQNFKVYTAEEFIAAITQHIPKKSFQMTRYYGFYLNKSRGLRLKNEEIFLTDKEGEKIKERDVEIIDVSRHQPRKVPSLKWRECKKKSGKIIL